jgi:opacity protein-like surface antigen
LNKAARYRQFLKECLPLAAAVALCLAGTARAAEQALRPPETALWKSGMGKGFQPEVHTLTLEAGASYGYAAFGGLQAHHLALTSLSYGHMLGPIVGDNHWYRGNPEWRVELFGGMQFSPDDDWLVGLTPHLRYNFATGTRWIPFLDGGAGVTATGIGPPDLGNIFEFNLQVGAGVHCFVRDNLALTVEARYIHLSCAGISQPNEGVNGAIGMVGLTWFF